MLNPQCYIFYSGSWSDWHLEYILIEETTSGKVFRFPCDNWLGKKFKTTRILYREDSAGDEDEIGKQKCCRYSFKTSGISA